MAEVMSRQVVTIKTRDGQTEASVFQPDSGVGPWPAVLVFMDWRGIRPALFALSERIAAAGYVVLLPDLFYRAGPYDAPSAQVLSPTLFDRHRLTLYRDATGQISRFA